MAACTSVAATPVTRTRLLRACNHHGGAGHSQPLCDELDQRLIGAPIDRWRGERDLQRISVNAGDAALPRAGMYPHAEECAVFAVGNGECGHAGFCAA